MRLEATAHFNNLSDKLRNELTTKIKSFGSSVRYKFNISTPNPDPSKYNGDTVWPNMYTLDPIKFEIIDPYETTSSKRAKLIAYVTEVDEKGIPSRFKKIQVKGGDKGVINLDPLRNEDDFNMALLIELHPKLKGGMFSDPNRVQIVERIDYDSLATEQRKIRSARKIAMDVAEKMSDEEIIQFSDAMLWDSTERPNVLRNKVEEMAEKEPQLFNDLVNSKKMKYQAAIKRAVDNKVFNYDPVDAKLIWASTGQVIVTLGSVNDGRSDYERFAEWFMTAGKKADDVYNKLVSLWKKEPV